MTEAFYKREQHRRIEQSIIDSIRPPTSGPEPCWIDMMQALDDLERAGGTGAVYPDSRVHAGDRHLDHPATAFFPVYGPWLHRAKIRQTDHPDAVGRACGDQLAR